MHALLVLCLATQSVAVHQTKLTAHLVSIDTIVHSPLHIIQHALCCTTQHNAGHAATMQARPAGKQASKQQSVQQHVTFLSDFPCSQGGRHTAHTSVVQSKARKQAGM